MDLYPRSSMRYRSSFDLVKLTEDARNELLDERPEHFKVFVLAVMAGLRRREIDTLEWAAFRWEIAAIRIEPTRYFQPKSEDSIGDVEVDPEVLEIFRTCWARDRQRAYKGERSATAERIAAARAQRKISGATLVRNSSRPDGLAFESDALSDGAIWSEASD